MKRSEALELIELQLESFTIYRALGHKERVRIYADIILDLLENKGMLPPAGKFPYIGTDGEKHIALQRTWEPEDD